MINIFINIKKSKKILFTCLIILLIICIPLTLVFANNNDNIIFDEIKIEDNYFLGQSLDIPDIKATIDSQKLETESLLVFPDERAFKGNNFILDKEGKYILRYSANFSGKKYYISKCFNVSSKLYSYGDKTEVSYGTYDSVSHLDTGDSIGSVKGLMLKLSQGDTFKYNKVIDLNKFDKDKNVISFCITPDKIGQEDISSIDVVFTDAYDSQNKITVNICNSIDGIEYANAYIKAKFEGAPFTGNEWNTSTKHVSNSFGYPVRLSFAGLLNHQVLKEISDNSVNLSFDYNEKELHSTIHQASSTSTVVCDFDKKEDFTDKWKGFKTGECFISIKSSGFVKEKANIVITSLGEQDISDFKFEERESPKVNVNLKEYSEENLPVAIVDKPYKLFEGSCISPYFGNLDVEVHVFANYFSNNKYELKIDDNYFIPELQGKYFIVYQSKDFFGNIGKKIISINVLNYSEQIEFELNEDEYLKSATAGDLIELKTPKVKGGSGNIQLSTKIEFENEIFIVENEKFRLPKKGIYKVIFEAIDYCQQKKQYTYDLVVNEGDKAQFISDVILPKYFINDTEYQIPSLYAYNYTDGSGDKIDCTISIEDSNGKKRVRNNIIKPHVRNNGEICTLTYYADIEQKQQNSISFKIPVVIVENQDGGLMLDRFFYSAENNVTMLLDENYAILTTAIDNSKIDFINPLVAHNFNFKFKSDSEYCGFERLSLILTDTHNEQQSLKLTYVKGTTTTSFYINDNYSEKYSASQLFSKSGDIFNIDLDLVQNLVSFDSNSSLKAIINTNIDGSKFCGFESGKVYLSIHFGNVTKLSKLNLLSINGQIFSTDDMEFVAPSIAILGFLGGIKSINSIVQVPFCISGDVIDPNALGYITIKDPDGNIVCSLEGVYIENIILGKEISLKVDKIGSYSIVLSSVDKYNNRNNINIFITVPDNVKPEINVLGKISDNYKIGEMIVLPKAEAIDNYSKNIKINMMVITEKGNIIVLKDRGFIPKNEGEYILGYWCEDEAGNMQIIDYKIKVN